jgi:type I restriction enzyme S subunit
MKGHVYSLRADCYVVSHLAILTPHGISTAFLKYILTFHRPNTLVKDSAYPSISLEDIKAFPIPVPSRNEQEKIVAELDCLSGIIEKKKQQLKELDALAQSIFYEMFGNSGESIPVSYYITGLSAGKSLAGDEECPNKVLKTGAVTYDHFDGNQVKNLPLEYVPIPSHKVNVNDLLISRMNTAELVGACAYVWWIDDSIYLPDRLWRAEINKLCHPVYLWKALTTDKAKEQIRNYASGTSGSMKNISKSSFLNVQIPKAPLIEQQLFASKIEAIEKQKELLKQSIQETETLFNSRMDYYFN